MGAIGVIKCEFVGCEFRGIGLAIPEGMIDEARLGMGLSGR